MSMGVPLSDALVRGESPHQGAPGNGKTGKGQPTVAHLL